MEPSQNVSVQRSIRIVLEELVAQMELTKELTGERLPQTKDTTILEDFNDNKYLDNLTDEEIFQRVENLLKDRIQSGGKEAYFQLGQLYFETGDFVNARKYLQQAIDHNDYQALFQVSVIIYDNLDQSSTPDPQLAFEYMKKVASSEEKEAKHLKFAALYNVGRAYFQGYGVGQSDEEAERYFLLAADDGNPKASIKAQSTLGLFYSRRDSQDLSKAFFWHSEACGNGSLESQGALGVMYLFGLGTKKDEDSAFICLREAAERGNVYAMGHLVSYYYSRKLFTKTVELAARVSLFRDVYAIAQETDTLPSYTAKGISIACFYYGRCLNLGIGVRKNDQEAQKYYSRSYEFDEDMCAHLQSLTQHGKI